MKLSNNVHMTILYLAFFLTMTLKYSLFLGYEMCSSRWRASFASAIFSALAPIELQILWRERTRWKKLNQRLTTYSYVSCSFKYTQSTHNTFYMSK